MASQCGGLLIKLLPLALVDSIHLTVAMIIFTFIVASEGFNTSMLLQKIVSVLNLSSALDLLI